MKVSELTPAERLFLHRFRNKQTQKEAAEENGVSLNMYRGWERGEGKVPKVPLGTIKPHEACVILRRRKGQGISELAEELGVCRWWLRQMETGAVNGTALREHWGV